MQNIACYSIINVINDLKWDKLSSVVTDKLILKRYDMHINK